MGRGFFRFVGFGLGLFGAARARLGTVTTLTDVKFGDDPFVKGGAPTTGKVPVALCVGTRGGF